MESQSLEPQLLEMLQVRYALGPMTRIVALEGGEWKKLFRLDGVQASFVVSISHPTTLRESVIYEHALLHYLHARLPQVPTPIADKDGNTFFCTQNRIIALYPLMPGQMAERDSARLPAARFLADFHRIGVNYPDHAVRPGIPAWREWDWAEPDWTTIQNMLTSDSHTASPAAQRFGPSGGVWTEQIVARRAQIIQGRAYFQRWLAELATNARPLAEGPMHDDYHRKNLLVEDGTISAFLDWDGCHRDWLVMDLATAIWEFCLEKAAHKLNLDHGRAFLAAYAAAQGPVTAPEFDLIVPFIRCRRMIEVVSVLQGIVTGETWNEDHAEYLVHNLISLDNLRAVQL